MKKPLILLAFGLALTLGARETQAQVIVSRNPYTTFAPRTVGFATVPGFPVYSYYAVMPFPAREYVGYGSNDFAYYGQPYGSPSDPWSWPTLSGFNYQLLSRYYYPPVR